MRYSWNKIDDFEFLNLTLKKINLEVMNREIYEDRDYPYKKNFKHHWRNWQGVEVEYRINDTLIVKGSRGKTVWYVPAIDGNAAKELGIEVGQAYKIIKYPVNNCIKLEYERLIKEVTIQNILAQNNMAPEVYEIIILVNEKSNLVNWFDLDYIHSQGSVYFALIQEHIRNDGLPEASLEMDSDYMFIGESVNAYKERCFELRINPYDLGLGNMFYSSDKNSLMTVDVHKWDRTYSISISDKPKYLQLELNNTCNAKCKMCNIPNMRRKKGIMRDDLFIKILKEANELGVEHITPFLHGEPLMRNDFIDKVRDINKYVPKANIEIFTNADNLDKCIVEELQEINNIQRLNLSFPGGTKEAYEKITGLNFEKVKSNILNAAKYLKVPIKINMPICEENKHTVSDFYELWIEVDKLDNVSIGTYDSYNYMGNIKNSTANKTYEHCDRIFRSMTVLYNGKVCLCCMDSEGEVILGDLSKQSIHEVWNDNKGIELRDKHNISRIYCDKCSVCNQNLYVEEY